MSDWMVISPGGSFAVSAAQSQTGEQRENCAFVMNVRSLIGAVTFTLAPGHELRRANAEEVALIRETIRQFASNSQFMIMPWEQSPDSNGKWEQLPEHDWRYFVIAFRGTNQVLEQLAEAFILAPLGLKVAFTNLQFVSGGRPSPALIMHAERLFLQLEDARWGRLPFVDVGESDVQEIVEIHAQVQKHEHPSIDIHRFTRELQELEGLPIRSSLLFLGYFGLLESLLTHQPDLKDPLDSITRQVKNKIALLQRRFKHPIDYGSFAGASSDTIWTKMYEYRSRLAHGDTPNFVGKLAILQNHQNALQLVEQAVKSVLRQALVEPQLLSDLRNC